MRIQISSVALAALRVTALGILALSLLKAALSEVRAGDCWGRLANPGFDGQRIKTTLFFAGQANDGSIPYECFIWPNLNTYTLNPEPRDTHLNWTNPANRDLVMNLMTNAGINVITMSSWGEDFLPCTDGWVTGAAPMQTSAQAHDELFAAATNKRLLIVPFIESRDKWSLRDEFPRWTDGRVAPGLVSQIVNLIQRYLKNPDHPEWSNVWAKIHDQSGTPRHAIVLIHASADHLDWGDDPSFAEGFDLVANEVAQATGIQVGFFIDAVARYSTFTAAFKPSPAFTGPYLRNSASLLGIQCFAPEIFSGQSSNEDLLGWKREFIRDWFKTGIPVLVDVSPGYDAHIVFGADAREAYGFTDEWMQGLTALADDYGRAGIVYNSWNGYTEGMAGTPTSERGNTFYDWLKVLNSDQSVHVDGNFSSPGSGTVSEPFQTVTLAWMEACHGDVIQIRSGNYPEVMAITKPLTLRAANGPVTIGQ